MRPTLRQLQYLVAIADTGKFGDAAKRVNVSQPSLSAQIAEMEAHLGTVLIERGRHPRFAIGESSTPLANLLLQQIAEEYALPQLLPLRRWGEWQWWERWAERQF